MCQHIFANSKSLKVSEGRIYIRFEGKPEYKYKVFIGKGKENTLNNLNDSIFQLLWHLLMDYWRSVINYKSSKT